MCSMCPLQARQSHAGCRSDRARFVPVGFRDDLPRGMGSLIDAPMQACFEQYAAAPTAARKPLRYTPVAHRPQFAVPQPRPRRRYAAPRCAAPRRAAPLIPINLPLQTPGATDRPPLAPVYPGEGLAGGRAGGRGRLGWGGGPSTCRTGQRILLRCRALRSSDHRRSRAG